ncbi:MAG: RNA polymerase sigma factor RpoD, partial [Myxococcales bacterium]|nr:RNA polymerase sigma factor RpoD [Myxococcales bacterium]
MTFGGSRKEIEQLVTLGKERGYLTFEEVNDALPPDVLSADQIDDMMHVLDKLNIKVVESADKAANDSGTSSEKSKSKSGSDDSD